MIEHPWLLLLLMLFLLYLLYSRVVKFYFRHPYLDGIKGNANNSDDAYVWVWYILLGAFLFTLAAIGVVWQTKEVARVFLAHKYVLVNDGSGSMVDNTKENGIGKELTSVLSGNDKLFDFLGKRNDGTKDLVGAIVFSNDAFVVSNLCDDPKLVQKKLKRIDYRAEPMNGGTDIESGLWAGLDVILSYKDVIKQDQLNHLQLRCYGVEHQPKLDPMLEAIIAKKESFNGSSIIIFTDGIFDPKGRPDKMSSYKIINFCKLVGIRVYFISIFDLDKDIIRYCKETGGRGDIIKGGYDKRQLEIIYEEIVTSQASEYEVKEQVKDQSFSYIFGTLGLVVVVLGLLKRSFNLNFTEV